MSESRKTLDDILDVIRVFVQERDWNRFHKPTALAVSAAIEVGELLEMFQWRTDDEISRALQSEEYRSALADEIADVMIYLLRLADVTGINPTDALLAKMKKNAQKYPSSRFQGIRPNTFKT